MADLPTIADAVDAPIADAARKHDCVVYYLRMDRLVKIGMTRNIYVRVKAIMPQGVLAIEPGGRPRERDRHAQFIRYHSHGEWYWLKEPLWEHIQQMRAMAPAWFGMNVEDWLWAQGVRSGQIPGPYEEA